MCTLMTSKTGSSRVTLTMFTSFIGFPSCIDTFMIANIFVLAKTFNPLSTFARPFYCVNSKTVRIFYFRSSKKGMWLQASDMAPMIFTSPSNHSLGQSLPLALFHNNLPLTNRIRNTNNINFPFSFL